MNIWKEVAGATGYEVSIYGEVRKIANQRVLKKTLVDNTARVSLVTDDGKRVVRHVNTIVAQAFKPELINTTHSIYNVDLDPTNNAVENLALRLRANNKYEGSECEVAGCDERPMSRNLCPRHYHAWYREFAEDVTHRDMKEIVGYAGAHQRLLLRKGKASTYTCECGQPASDWALQSLEAETLYKQVNQFQKGLVYSLNPDDYKPMCKACHVAYDKKARGTLIQRFNDHIEVTVEERQRRSELDWEAMTAEVKELKHLTKVAEKYGIKTAYMGKIFETIEGQSFREWKRAAQAQESEAA